jgi:hypothetical protein
MFFDIRFDILLLTHPLNLLIYSSFIRITSCSLPFPV